MNVLGVIARAHAHDVPLVAAALQEIDGVDVAATSPEGHLILVIEDSAGQPAAAAMAQVALHPRILSTSLVYEYAGAITPADGFDSYSAWRMSTHELAARRATPDAA